MAEAKKSEKTEENNRIKILKYTLLGTVALLILLLISFGGYSLFHNKKVYANQYLGDFKVSGSSKEELKKTLKENSEKYLAKKVVLSNSDTQKKYELDPIEIGLNFDIEKTAENIWQYGRNQNMGGAFLEQLSSIFQKKQHSYIFLTNEESLKLKITSIAGELDQPEKDYALEYKDGKFELISERAAGKRIDQDKINIGLKSQFKVLNSGELKFDLNSYSPQVSESKAKARLTEANKIIASGELVLKFSSDIFKADIDTIGAFILSKTNRDDLDITFNDERIKKYVETIAKSLNVEPVNAKLKITDGKATVFEQSRIGKVLKQEETIQKIKDALLARINGVNNPVTMVVETKKPEVDAGDINNYGIVELIGSATTSFKGSPANRVHNITIGTNLINGVMLKPDEVFSTLGHLGVIDASGGYLEELVIKENSTVAEFGGGLCQVSSTLFRAAINSGVKITERQNHKYRVGYFEPPYGMDATIYDPAPDFKFLNNYKSHILIQSKIEGTNLTFEFYGTKDGRKIEVGTPSIFNFVNPQEPIIVETDTLAPGVKKQIEKAHQGATTSFSYKVTSSSGEVLQEKNFLSKYVPWPEKWLVGKQPEVVAETPAPTCSDAVQNSDETGVDCGGNCANLCQ